MKHHNFQNLVEALFDTESHYCDHFLPNTLDIVLLQ